MNYIKHYLPAPFNAIRGLSVSGQPVPQSEPIPGMHQVPNSAGGYSFAVDDWTRLRRFLILGSEGGSYYAGERELTVQNCDTAIRCLAADGPRTVALVEEISQAGRAPKNDPALMVLALAMSQGDVATRTAAEQALPKVARIGTHLFQFVESVDALRGWGRRLKRAVSNWYEKRGADKLALQMLKYQQREGWAHRDVLRLCHPAGATAAHKALYAFATHKVVNSDTPALVHGYLELQAASDVPSAVLALERFPGLTWEMVPTKHLTSPLIWETLLPRMGLTALIRKLPVMTTCGLVKPLSSAARTIAERLGNVEALREARVHPLQMLVALTAYKTGRGRDRGDGNQRIWEPVAQVLDALDAGFYAAFGNVEPTGKQTLLALDVSGSMDYNMSALPGITCRVTAAAMALVTAAVEPNHGFVAFCDRMVPLDISPRQRLDDVCRVVDRSDYGGTDCSLPMKWALAESIPVETFVVYTDGESWAGDRHPVQALREYRERTGIQAKLVAVSLVANQFTIADPNDAGMLDVVGFDTAAPQLISDFARE